MIIGKIIELELEDTIANSLSLNFFRNDDGCDGVLFIAWHADKENEILIQTDFLIMSIDHAHSFLRDYSTASAIDYVNSFEN